MRRNTFQKDLLEGGNGTCLEFQQRQVNLCVFKASLVYKVSSRTIRAITQRNPVLKITNKQTNKQTNKHKRSAGIKELRNVAQNFPS